MKNISKVATVCWALIIGASFTANLILALALVETQGHLESAWDTAFAAEDRADHAEKSASLIKEDAEKAEWRFKHELELRRKWCAHLSSCKACEAWDYSKEHCPASDELRDHADGKVTCRKWHDVVHRMMYWTPERPEIPAE